MNNNIFIDIDCIIGIDPGSNGGIAVYRLDLPVETKKMPKDVNELGELLSYYKNITHPIVFLEKLSVRPDDILGGDAGHPNMGKMYRIQKMMQNYEQLKAVIRLTGLPYILVHPMKWQMGLNLRLKGKHITETKQERKGRYKATAQNLYPYINVTLWNADALLIMHFGRWALKNNPSWLTDNVERAKSRLL